MTLRPVVLALTLALAASVALVGCDNPSTLTAQEHIQRAKDFEDQGKIKGSIVELKNAIQKSPDNAQARMLLGQLYLKAGMGAGAEKELRQAEQLGVNRETIKPLLGEALLLMGEYKRILDEIEPGERTSKVNTARIYQIRADALLKLGNTKDACNLFQQSLDTHSGNPATYWGLAQCAVAERNLAKARAWLDSALKLNTSQAKTWILAGNLALFEKNPGSALAAYTNALKSEPGNLEALQSRAAVYMAQAQLENARADVDRLARLAPKSLPSHYLQALLHFELKQYPEAQADLHEILSKQPDYMPGVLIAGATAYALGSYQQAESYLNQFLARSPHHAYARRVLAATQIKQKLPEKSLETLAPLLTVNSRDAAALALAGEALLLKGESAKATAYLQRAVEIDPKNAAIQTQLGISHLSSGESQLAIAELGQAAALDPGPHKADTLLVMTHITLKEYDKALAAIQSLEKKRPNSAVLLTMRGNALFGKKDFPNARKNFEQALAIDPVFFQAAISLAQLDLIEKKPDMAAQRFERLLARDSTNLYAMISLAELAAMNKQEKAYVSWLEKAAKAHPDAIPPRAMLARHYLAAKNPGKALAIANEALTTNPDNPAALDLLGSVQLAVNDNASATTTFTQLAKKSSQSPDSLLRLARVQISGNKLTDARATLQKILQIRPDHLLAQDVLVRLEMKEGKPDAALQVARRVQTQHPRSPLGFEREGDINLYQKHPAPAVKAFELSLSRGAGSAGLIKLCRAHTLSGNPAAAEQLLDNWIKRNPDDLAVRVYAAGNHAANGQNKAAIADYQAVLQQSPQNVLALNNLSNLYLQEADSRARPTAEQALKLAPDNPAIQDTLGWILVEQGQAQRGLDLLRRAIAKSPNNVSIRYHHAIALTRTGDKVGARKALMQLLKDAPASPEALAAKAQLQKL